MGDGTPKKLNILPDHFSAPSSTAESSQGDTPSSPQPKDNTSLGSHSQSRTRRNLKRAATMLNLFTLRRLPWVSDGQEKVELSAAELESLRSELSDLEEREAYLKAQLEHVDEVLRSARLSGYLFIRSRWAALPGEPPPIDDTEVDDWLPRFVVLQGPCLFFYLLSTDLSPQDSTLLADIVEVGSLPSYTREFDETHYCFYILTRQGLRFECSSTSKTQVDSWLSVLRLDCKSEPEERLPNGSSEAPQ
ncbi:Pleckstrin homology domain [Arabidopsis suecica]|uniref:Pleckstrin homology domain n=1 Tax=Arabidopsis suecica TaxID=45249 RepID=A0A8T1YK37_ARASU|nr:Pleckstrin homology domain [Arabidopsis suecica]KAG7546404.1 Pleckstrin homology domain [Arabidopsis suecica]